MKKAANNKVYLIGKIAEISGVSSSTLRAWEQRYGFPKPSRISEKLRYYSENDLAQIQRMKEMIENGWSPSGAAGQLKKELAEEDQEKKSLSNQNLRRSRSKKVKSDQNVLSVTGEFGQPKKDSPNHILTLEALNLLMHALLQSNTRSQMLDAALNELVTTFKADAGLIFLLNPVDGNLTLEAHIGVSDKFVEEAELLPIGTGIAGRVALTGEPIIVENISVDPRLTFTMAREEGFRPLLCYPLLSNRRVQGVVSLLNKNKRIFSPQDLELIGLLVPHLGRAIEYNRLQEELASHQREQMRAIQRQVAEIDALRQETNLGLALAIEKNVIAPLEQFQEKCKVSQARKPNELEIALNGAYQVLDKLPRPSLPQASLLKLLNQEIIPYLVQKGNNQLEISNDNWPDKLPAETNQQLYDGIKQLFHGLSQSPDFSNTVFHLTLQATARQLKVQLLANTAVVEALRNQLIGQNLPEWFLRVRATMQLLGGEARLERNEPDAQTGLVIILPRYWDNGAEQTRIRVVLAEDQPLLRQALVNILGTDPHLELVAMAEQGLQCLELARYLQPDILLTDVSLPDMDGSTLTRLFKNEHPQAKVILLAAYDNNTIAAQGLEVGASACLLKNVLPNELLQTIRAVYEGHFIFSASLANKYLAQTRLKTPSPIAKESLISSEVTGRNEDNRLDLLTERELEVLKGLAEGYTGNQLARNLGITEKTLRQHISNIYQKLKIYDRVQLALYAVRQGL